MHYIQQKILHGLTLNEAARYSELRPKDIESNHFIYHLKQLIKDGLVRKNEAGLYALTSKGQAFADRLSLTNMRPRSQPKIVNLIVCENEQGEVLLYRRKKQPFYDQVGFPFGKIHLGETISLSSWRELEEKTGLKADLRHIGDVYITVYEGETLVTHTLFHIHYGTPSGGELIAENSSGVAFWGSVRKNDSPSYMPGVLEIYQLVKSRPKGRFFEEFEYKI